MLQFWDDYLANPDKESYHGKPQGARAFREGYIYAMISKYATYDTGWNFATETRIHDDILRRASAKGDWYNEDILAEAFFDTIEGKKILEDHPDELSKWKSGGEYCDEVNKLLAPWTYNATPLVLQDGVTIRDGGSEFNKVGVIYQFVSPFDYDFRESMNFSLNGDKGFVIEPYICSAPVAISDVGRYTPLGMRNSSPAVIRNLKAVDYPMSHLIGASAGSDGVLPQPDGFRIPDISDGQVRWNTIVKPGYSNPANRSFADMTSIYSNGGNRINDRLIATNSLYGQLRRLSKYVSQSDWKAISPQMRSFVSKNYGDLERLRSIELTERVCSYLKEQNVDFTFRAHKYGFAISIPSRNLSILTLSTSEYRGMITDWKSTMERSAYLNRQEYYEKNGSWKAEAMKTPAPIDITMDFIKWRLGDESIKLKHYGVDLDSVIPGRMNDGEATIGNLSEVERHVPDFWWKSVGSASQISYAGIGGNDATQHYGHRILFATSAVPSGYGLMNTRSVKYEARIVMANPSDYKSSDYNQIFGGLNEVSSDKKGDFIYHKHLPISIPSQAYCFYRNLFENRFNRMHALPLPLIDPDLRADVSTEMVDVGGYRVEREVYNAEFAEIVSQLTDQERAAFNIDKITKGRNGKPDTYSMNMTIEEIKSCPIKLDCAFLKEYVNASPSDKQAMYNRAIEANKALANATPEERRTMDPSVYGFLLPDVFKSENSFERINNLVVNYPPVYYRNILKDMVDNAKERFVESLDMDSTIQLARTKPDDYEYGDIDRTDLSAVMKKNLFDSVSRWQSEGRTELEQEGLIRDWLDETLETNFGDVPPLTIGSDGTYVVDRRSRQHLNTTNVCRYSDLYSGHAKRKKDGWATYKMMGAIITQLPGRVADWCTTNDDFGSTLAGEYKKLSKTTYKPYMKGTADGKIEYVDPMDGRPMGKEMMEALKTSLLNTGVVVNEDFEIGIDNQGIMHYECAVNRTMKSGNSTGTSLMVMTGNIGQVVEFDEYGACSYSAIKHDLSEGNSAAFESGWEHESFDEMEEVDDDALTSEDQAGQSMMIIPGYVADFDPIDMSDRHKVKTLAQRLKLRGIRDLLKDSISQSVKDNIYGIDKINRMSATETVLNDAYKKSCDTLIPKAVYDLKVANIEKFKAAGTLFTPLDDPEQDALRREALTDLNVFETYKGRCRFPTKYIESCTTNCQSMLEHPDEEESQNFDFELSNYVDNMNFRVLDETFDGIFDPNMTSTAKNQGIVRFLVGVPDENGMLKVITPNADGHVTPVVNEDGSIPECPLSSDEMMEYQYFDPVDRRQMASSQLLTAYRTLRDVPTALMTIDGLTFDDGYVMSRRFAERGSILSHDPNVPLGTMRNLTIGDKGSDCDGNKGVTTMVVDGDYYSGNLREKMVPESVNVTGPVDGKYRYVADIRFKDRRYHIDKELDESRFYNEAGIRIDADAVADIYRDEAVQSIQEQEDYKDMDDVLKLFYENPKLDLVMSPYSIASRMNGGSIRRLAAHPMPLTINGKVIEGGMGLTNFIIVDKPVDIKNHYYHSDAGEGRNMSGQLIWGLQSAGANDVLNELTSYNADSVFKVREALIAMGMDLDPQTLEVHLGYNAGDDIQRRNIFRIPDKETMQNGVMDLIRNGSTVKDGLFVLSQSISGVMDDELQTFYTNLHNYGGFIPCPVPLHFNMKGVGAVDANGKPVDETVRSKYYTDEKNICIPSLKDMSDAVDGDYKTKMYGIPVIPPNMRVGMNLNEHQITERYMRIYRNLVALKFMTTYNNMLADSNIRREMIDAYMEKNKCSFADAQNGIDALGKLMQKGAANQISNLKVNFNIAQTMICDKFLTGKHNLMREGVFKKKLDNSATVVWSADPRLGVNEVSMSMEHAKMLDLCQLKKGVKAIRDPKTGEITNSLSDYELIPDAKVMLWRDPILMDGGCRYMSVVIDNNVEGIRVNPLADKSFEGDFDGDTVAIKKLDTKEAQICAERTLSHKANLLSKGSLNEPDENGNYPNGKYALYINKGMDVASNSYSNPELDERRMSIQRSVNEFEEYADQANSLFRSVAKRYHEEMINALTGDGNVSAETKGEYLSSARIAEWLRSTSDQRIMTTTVESDEMVDYGEKMVACVAKQMGIKINPDEDIWSQIDPANLDNISDKDAKILNRFLAVVTRPDRMNQLVSKVDYMSDLDKIIDIGRDYYMDAVNQYAKDSLKGIGTAHIIVKDSNTIMKSIKQFVVDHGAKGKEKKIPDMARHLGIQIDMENDPNFDNTHDIVDANGKVIPAAVADGTYREEDKKVWETVAYKADNTCVAGMTSQHGVSAMRNLCLKEVLELTYPVTQGVLQSKHDPIDAKDKDGIIKFWGKKVWDGVALSGDWDRYLDPECDPDEIIHAKHVPVEGVTCTPELWSKQIKGMLKALKVDFNPEFVEVLAENMTVTEPDGTKRVLGLHDMIKENGSLMDVMSYSNDTDVYSSVVERVMTPYLYKKNRKTGEMSPLMTQFEREAYEKDLTKRSLLGTTNPAEVVESVYADMAAKIEYADATDESARADIKLRQRMNHELLSNTTIILPVMVREMVANANTGDLTVVKNRAVAFGVGSSYHRDSDRFVKGMTFVGEAAQSYRDREAAYADYLAGKKTQAETKTSLGYNMPEATVDLTHEQIEARNETARRELEKAEARARRRAEAEQKTQSVAAPSVPKVPPFDNPPVKHAGVGDDDRQPADS